jgi:hypothetical protein
MKVLDRCPSLSDNRFGVHPLQHLLRNADYPLTVSQTTKKTAKTSSTTRKRYHDIGTIGIVPRHHPATGTLVSLTHKRQLTSTDVPQRCMHRNLWRLRTKHGMLTFVFSSGLLGTNDIV